MEFARRDAPYVTPSTDVQSVMLHVVLALIPAALAYVWFFGFGFVFNLLIATVFCALGEAGIQQARLPGEGEVAHERPCPASGCETLAAFGATAIDDLAAALGGHPRTETVSALTLQYAGLKSSFHDNNPD